ncbi:MAG: nitrous oxide reductase family maturation protein NosD [Candidatus Hermodarchaeota archaeon]
MSIVLIVGFSLFLNIGYINNTNTDMYSYDQILVSLHPSGTYENITIDALSWNNWTWAESQEWCSGQGTLQNPYVIQGHTLGVDTIHDGIKVSNSDDVYFTIRDCTVFWDGFIATGMETGISITNSSKGIIMNNTVHHISSGIRIVYCEDLNITDNKVYSAMAGIYFTFSEFCELDGNIVYNTDNGIFLTYSENNNLRNNIAYSNEYGIFFTYSYYNEVIGNTVDNNDIGGIKLMYSNSNNITDNDSRGNLDGIHLEDECDNNTLDYNDFSNNNIGIEMYYSDFNTIAENIAENNQYYGIRLEVCENNTVTRNIFKNNTQYGAYVEMGSHNNTFYENFFVQNGVHAFNEGLNCSWNSPTIGNYWDNHTAPDVSPQDGIVDVPYTYISGLTESIDYLPIAEDGAPSITIHSPSEGSSFGSNAPTLIVEVTDSTPLELWYTLDGGLHNYTFYYIEIHTFTYTRFAGVVDQSAWDALSDGSVIIRFYASDVVGNKAFEEVTITKSISPGGPPEGLDPGLLVFIVIISLVGGIAVIAVAYIFLKKRRE